MPAGATPNGSKPAGQNGKPLATAEQIAEFEQAGAELYGVEWEVKRRQLCEAKSTGGTSKPEELSAKEIGELLTGLKERLAAKPAKSSKQPALVAEQ